MFDGIGGGVYFILLRKWRWFLLGMMEGRCGGRVVFHGGGCSFFMTVAVVFVFDTGDVYVCWRWSIFYCGGGGGVCSV